MAERDLTKALTGVRGRIYKGVTEVPPVTAPFGGVELGEVLEVQLERVEEVTYVQAYEWGFPVEAVSRGAGWLIGAAFASWDSDVLGALFPEASAAGGTSGQPGLTVSTDNGGSRVVGRRLSAKADKLLFLADDAEHPSVLMWSAMPVLAERVELPLRPQASAYIRATWLAIPDTSRDDSDDKLQLRLARDLTP